MVPAICRPVEANTSHLHHYGSISRMQMGWSLAPATRGALSSHHQPMLGRGVHHPTSALSGCHTSTRGVRVAHRSSQRGLVQVVHATARHDYSEARGDSAPASHSTAGPFAKDPSQVLTTEAVSPIKPTKASKVANLLAELSAANAQIAALQNALELPVVCGEAATPDNAPISRAAVERVVAGLKAAQRAAGAEWRAAFRKQLLEAQEATTATTAAAPVTDSSGVQGAEHALVEELRAQLAAAQAQVASLQAAAELKEQKMKAEQEAVVSAVVEAAEGELQAQLERQRARYKASLSQMKAEHEAAMRAAAEVADQELWRRLQLQKVAQEAAVVQMTAAHEATIRVAGETAEGELQRQLEQQRAAHEAEVVKMKAEHEAAINMVADAAATQLWLRLQQQKATQEAEVMQMTAAHEAAISAAKVTVEDELTRQLERQHGMHEAAAELMAVGHLADLQAADAQSQRQLEQQSAEHAAVTEQMKATADATISAWAAQAAALQLQLQQQIVAYERRAAQLVADHDAESESIRAAAAAASDALLQEARAKHSQAVEAHEVELSAARAESAAVAAAAAEQREQSHAAVAAELQRLLDDKTAAYDDAVRDAIKLSVTLGEQARTKDAALAEAGQQALDFKGRWQEAAAEGAELASEVARLREERDLHTREVSSLLDDAREYLGQPMDDAKNLTAVRKELKDCQGLLKTRDAEAAYLRQRLQKLKEEHLDEVVAQGAGLGAYLQKSEQEAADLRQRLQKLKEEHDDEVASLQAEVQTAEQEAASLWQWVLLLEQEARATAAATTAAEQVPTGAATGQDTAAEMTTLRAELKAREDEAASLRRQVEQLKMGLGDVVVEVASLQALLADSQRALLVAQPPPASEARSYARDAPCHNLMRDHSKYLPWGVPPGSLFLGEPNAPSPAEAEPQVSDVDVALQPQASNVGMVLQPQADNMVVPDKETSNVPMGSLDDDALEDHEPQPQPDVVVPEYNGKTAQDKLVSAVKAFSEADVLYAYETLNVLLSLGLKALPPKSASADDEQALSTPKPPSYLAEVSRQKLIVAVRQLSEEDAEYAHQSLNVLLEVEMESPEYEALLDRVVTEGVADSCDEDAQLAQAGRASKPGGRRVGHDGARPPGRDFVRMSEDRASSRSVSSSASARPRARLPRRR